MTDDLIERLENGNTQGNETWPELCKEAAARIRELEAQGVAVKPLVWWRPSADNNWTHGARTILGTYYVHIDGGRHQAWLEELGGGKEAWFGEPCGHLFKAMEHAQADYEARIRSALTPAPVTVGEAARVLLNDNKAIDRAFDACDPKIEKMAIDYAGNQMDPVGQLEIAEDFFRAALRTLAEGGE